MLKKSKQLDAKIKSLQSQLSAFPEGKLFCTCNGKYQKWYQSNGHNHIYIPKKKRQLAQELAAKKYVSLLIEDLQNEKNAINFYLKHHKSGNAEQLFEDESPYRELLLPFFTPNSEEICQWMNEIYEKKSDYPEQLIYKTGSGNFVRSKSEVMIDMFLYINKIPFRYECALKLKSVTIYPDFTIKHPKTGEIYYWEHFGLMDDPSYYKNAYTKMQLYTSNGIIPSINLITTYETKANPLNPDMIQKIIEHYFL